MVTRGLLSLFIYFLHLTLPKILLGSSKLMYDSGVKQTSKVFLASLAYKY
jgi:hypothetical protein